MKREVIYQIFVRNHSIEGTFKKVEEDLQRIKDLGVTIVYLMPIHEIGLLNRKGNMGSPYSIKDYFSISKDLGDKNDLISLINKTHELGMKIIVDMVLNHTSRDNPLMTEHPEYYYHPGGDKQKFGNKVGDWSDVCDLETSREDTQEYLLSVLKYWIDVGFDGFRFDVASLIPLDFFKKARKTLGNDVIFFAETIDDDFVRYAKEIGFKVTPDKDLYPTFTILYNYNWYRHLEHYLLGYEETLDKVVDSINKDEILPKGVYRVNALENHDTERIASFIKDEDSVKKITDFVFDLSGHIFIYAGEEYLEDHRPNLFEKDPLIWEKYKQDKSLRYFSYLKNEIKNKNELKEHSKIELSDLAFL